MRQRCRRAVMAIRSTRAAESGEALTKAFAHMFRGDLLALPVHAGGLAVVDLHTVHAYVALAGLWITRDDAGEGV